jgi:hypothetical protein
MANLKDVAGDVGLRAIECKCGHRINGLEALERMFAHIVELCRVGQEVRIKNFGVFSARLLKGRRLETPINVGRDRFGDTLILRFHQTTGAKKMLNIIQLKTDKKTGRKKR